jgi:hypothetical protein
MVLVSRAEPYRPEGWGESGSWINDGGILGSFGARAVACSCVNMASNIKTSGSVILASFGAGA